MTSGGKRKPAKADCEREQGEGEFSCQQCRYPDTVAANATVPSVTERRVIFWLSADTTDG